MEASIHLEEGELTAALESLQTIFGLAHMVGNEPWLQAQPWRLYRLAR